MTLFAMVGAVVMLPVRLAHEATHVVAGWPWANSWSIRVRLSRLTTRIHFADDTPTWAVYWTHLAPFLVGLLMAAAAAVGLAAGVVTLDVRGPVEALLMVVAAWAWIAYAYPSRRDRTPSRTSQSKEER